ncbi:hypothetical protein GF336_07350 [Candidatus Woesearchaeota archaeon]|nr:hypothetical protein [Candidatus Woesearchaeota archaeon]
MNNKFKDFYSLNMKETKQKIKESVSDENFILQTINYIGELDRIFNILMKRLREWYELYNPEFSRRVQDHAKFVELILEGNDEKENDSMGADIDKKDLKEIKDIALRAKDIFSERKSKEEYLEKLMKEVCPNLTAVAGVTIGAKLISLAGDLKRLMLFPSSTVQLLGAEKALFRHMKTGARSPKHGIIHEHPLVASAKDKGKAARAVADKISLAVKVDYFKGEFIGGKLRKELEERLK